MRRAVLLLVLSLAAMTAAETVLHAHSLTPEPASTAISAPAMLRCSICSTITARILFDAPEIVAPVEVAAVPAAFVAHAAPESPVPPLPSRAPPAT